MLVRLHLDEGALLKGRHPRPVGGVAEVRGAYADAVVVAAVPSAAVLLP